MQSSNVALFAGSVPCERGNISYQAAKRAAGPVDHHLQLVWVATARARSGARAMRRLTRMRNEQREAVGLA